MYDWNSCPIFDALTSEIELSLLSHKYETSNIFYRVEKTYTFLIYNLKF